MNAPVLFAVGSLLDLTSRTAIPVTGANVMFKFFFFFTGFRERSCKNCDNLNFRKLEIILKVSGIYLLFSNAAELFSTAVF